ncbi:MAG: glycosyltransferase family 2 protein [Hyphomicrobiaceae bacterium]
MNDHVPAFTVVVPLYNTERYIAATLDSILAQTFADFEIVVVNDASTDRGPTIVDSYIARDARIRMVTQDNRGLAGARNSGIRQARGSYIALLDADDLWTPDKLALHKAHLDVNLDIGVSFAPSLFIDENGASLGIAQTPKLDDIDAEHVFCRNPVGNGSAAVLRRAAVDDIAFTIEVDGSSRTCWFDETFRQSEDIELWTRIIATTSWRFGGIPQTLTHYRVNSGGLSADVDKQFASWRRFRDKLAGIAPDLVAKAGRRAEAYQCRYLARRAAISGAGATALSLMATGLRHHPHMLVEEPTRTILTFGFSCLALITPASLFGAIKDAVFKSTAKRPRPVLSIGPVLAAASPP